MRLDQMVRDRRVLAAAVLGLLLLVGAVWWALAAGGGIAAGPEQPGATTSPTGSVAPAVTPSPSEDLPATPAPEPSVDPPSAPPSEEPAGPTGPDASEPTASPVALEEPAPFGTDVVARLVEVEAIDAEALGPGEVAGPALRLTVELTNGTAGAVSLSTTVVNLYAGPQDRPTELLIGSGTRWFEGELAAGRSATGVYVFSVPADLRDRVRITVTYDPDAPTVLFEGAAPPAG